MSKKAAEEVKRAWDDARDLACKRTEATVSLNLSQLATLQAWVIVAVEAKEFPESEREKFREILDALNNYRI